MIGSPLWAFFDEDDYDEESNAEIWDEDENSPEMVEYDEWGNEIETIDGFQYSDIDKTIKAERAFNKHLQYLSNAKKPVKKLDKPCPHLNGCRTETHLYQDRDKF